VVEDLSMAPTLVPGDRLWVDPRALRGRAPRPGEVVVLPDPGVPDRWLIKRIAAVGPAVVHTVRTGVVVQGPTDRAAAPPDAIESTPVPPGSVFVVSDAPSAGARDSRTFGPVPAERLWGVAWYRYAPAATAGALPPSPL
jgi:signal peptidase I